MRGLRFRLATTFALVALATGAAVAVTAPSIIGSGFARLQGDAAGSPGGPGPGAGLGPGGHAAEIQQDTILAIVVVALVAALVASALGFLIAGRIAGPLERLGAAARAVAGGDLRRRSGLDGHADEIGDLGRSFDAMAEDLEAAESARRRFFQDAAHELKTPIAVIDATSSAVLDGVYPPDARHLETIRGQARVLGRIVDDLRTVSLAETGDLPLHLEPVAAGDALAAAATAFEARAGTAGVTLEPAPAPGLIVRADRERLAQILGAYLDNAIRHTPAGGRISLVARPSGPTVRLSVADTGSGLAPGDAERVFDRFFQADPARDRASGTSGLGLTIVRALAEAMHGRAGAGPTPGGGATFWVELPGADA
jgi:two-component system sensor histidine kinase BaeS